MIKSLFKKKKKTNIVTIVTVIYINMYLLINFPGINYSCTTNHSGSLKNETKDGRKRKRLFEIPCCTCLNWLGIDGFGTGTKDSVQ
jgi:hypothetical protein